MIEVYASTDCLKVTHKHQSNEAAIFLRLSKKKTGKSKYSGELLCYFCRNSQGNPICCQPALVTSGTDPWFCCIVVATAAALDIFGSTFIYLS